VRTRSGVLLAGIVLVVSGVANFAIWQRDLVGRDAPDFEINWVAGHQLVDRTSVYDRIASEELGVKIVGPAFAELNEGTYTSFIGTPVTALFYAPFTVLSVDTAIDWWRVLEVVLMLAAIVIVALALDRSSRVPAALIGIGAFLWSYPVAMALRLGNVDGFLMFSIALAIWSSSRGRWRLAGGMLGFAALLKVSPGVLLVYLVLRGRRQVVVPAVATVAALLAAAAVVGRPRDLLTWFTDVLPDIGQGGFFTNNQSVPASLARAFGENHDWLSFELTLGWWRWISWIVLVGGVGLVLLVRRGRPYLPLELGAVLLVALLAGPITWDFYLSWALLAVVLMADVRWWDRRPRGETIVLVGMAVAALAVLRRWTLYPVPELVASDWSLRLETALPTIAVAVLFAMALALLERRPGPGETAELPVSDEQVVKTRRRPRRQASERSPCRSRWWPR
jgi:hypothetical protein